MAINPETQYPGKITPSSADYPYGQARNISSPGDGTGTPWEAALVNDLFGHQQALLSEASITPSGTPEKATLSQYLQAAKKIHGGILPSIAESLAGLPESLLLDGQRYYVLGWKTDTEVGGGGLVYRSSVPKSSHNGITVYSPSVPAVSAQAGSDENERVGNYLAGAGETDPGGSGCLVRENFSRAFSSWAGAVPGAVGDSTSALDAFFAYADVAGVPCIVVPGEYNYTPTTTKTFTNKVILWGPQAVLNIESKPLYDAALNVHFAFEGGGSVFEGFDLRSKYDGLFQDRPSGNGTLLRVQGGSGDRCKLRGLRLEGAVQMYRIDDNFCEVHDVEMIGYGTLATLTSVTGDHNEITKCEASGANAHFVVNGGAYNLHFDCHSKGGCDETGFDDIGGTQNWWLNCSGTGISPVAGNPAFRIGQNAAPAIGSVVRGCVAYSNGGDGIRVFGDISNPDGEIELTGNRCSDNGADGIRVQAGRVKSSRNKTRGNDGRGIRFRCDGETVAGSSSHDECIGNAYGISLDTTSGAVTAFYFEIIDPYCEDNTSANMYIEHWRNVNIRGGFLNSTTAGASANGLQLEGNTNFTQVTELTIHSNHTDQFLDNGVGTYDLTRVRDETWAAVA